MTVMVSSRTALRYQNTLVQNALIRGLNNVYEYAGSIVDGKHKSFKEFMEYNQVVREMIQLHIDGKSRNCEWVGLALTRA